MLPGREKGRVRFFRRARPFSVRFSDFRRILLVSRSFRIPSEVFPAHVFNFFVQGLALLLAEQAAHFAAHARQIAAFQDGAVNLVVSAGAQPLIPDLVPNLLFVVLSQLGQFLFTGGFFLRPGRRDFLRSLLRRGLCSVLRLFVHGGLVHCRRECRFRFDGGFGLFLRFRGRFLGGTAAGGSGFCPVLRFFIPGGLAGCRGRCRFRLGSVLFEL